jgi:hypothetical protein
MRRHFTSKKKCISKCDDALTQKELLLQLEQFDNDSKIYVCKCGKEYSYKESLCRHQKNCMRHEDYLLAEVMRKIRLDYNNCKNRKLDRNEKVYEFKDTSITVKYNV